jgi:hypothetical protein
MKTIELVGIDHDGHEASCTIEVDTIKEARQDAKGMATASYWDESAEQPGYWKQISHVALRVNGEEHSRFEIINDITTA